MKLLLDTHVFLWAIADPARLSPAAREVLENEDNSLWLSVVSLWEIAIKVQAGKLQLPASESYFREHLEKLGVERVLGIEATHIYALLILPVHHKDPFDRLLIAQCRVEKVTLVSADPVLSQYPIEVVW